MSPHFLYGQVRYDCHSVIGFTLALSFVTRTTHQRLLSYELALFLFISPTLVVLTWLDNQWSKLWLLGIQAVTSPALHTQSLSVALVGDLDCIRSPALPRTHPIVHWILVQSAAFEMYAVVGIATRILFAFTYSSEL
jgi:hypothetical protein